VKKQYISAEKASRIRKMRQPSKLARTHRRLWAKIAFASPSQGVKQNGKKSAIQTGSREASELTSDP